MPEQSRKQPIEPNLSSIEGNLFGVLFNFHEKTMDLLRQASLKDDKQDLVAERIKTLLEGATADMKRTKDFSNLSQRLEAAYAEVKRLVDEVSEPDRECSNGEQASTPK